MPTYNVKVETTLYYDKNYAVEADSELEANDIAESVAKKDWDYKGDSFEWYNEWELGDTVQHDVVYIEESY